MSNSNTNTNTGGSNWRATRSGGTIASIEKVFHFADFAGSMAFAQQVADLAQRQNHHPTLLVQWGTCVVRWSSHDAGNTVTPLDVECAALTDALMPAGQA